MLIVRGKVFLLAALMVSFLSDPIQAQSKEPVPLTAAQRQFADLYSSNTCSNILSIYARYIEQFRVTRQTYLVLVYTEIYNSFKKSCDQAAAFRAQQAAYDAWDKARREAPKPAPAPVAPPKPAPSPSPAPAPVAPTPAPAPVASSVEESNKLYGALPAKLNDTYYDSHVVPTSHKAINMMEGWKNLGRKCAPVVVFDTGIDYNHPDLKSNIAPQKGYNYVANKQDALDDQGHGTGVAGVIGALANNGQGVAGVCWGTEITPIKVMNNQGQGTMSDIMRGFAGVNSQRNSSSPFTVYNFSLSIVNALNYEFQTGAKAFSIGVTESIIDAGKKNVLVVFASGNDGKNLGPVSYATKAPANLLTVGATDGKTGASASFSNFAGSTNIFSPGANIASTARNNSYSTMSGTSFSAPLEAAAAALYGYSKKGLTVEQIRNDMLNKSSALNDPRVGSVKTLNFSVLK